jgi:hypothetical protein
VEKSASSFFESVKVIRPEPREECISTLRVPTQSKTLGVFSFLGSDDPQNDADEIAGAGLTRGTAPVTNNKRKIRLVTGRHGGRPDAAALLVEVKDLRF